MKKLFMFIAVIVLTTLIVNGVNRHKRNHMRFNHEGQKSEMREKSNERFNHEGQKPDMKFNRHNQKQMKCNCDSIRFDKSKTAYVEVGRLLKPYEVANLMLNNSL